MIHKMIHLGLLLCFLQLIMSNYMDGIKVKISEKYKPPAKISLLMTYSQRLKLNKQIEDNLPNYEFNLENTVKEKMCEWRNVRKTVLNERNERLLKAKDEYNKIICDRKQTDVDIDEKINQNSHNFMPIQSYSNILTPIPLNVNENSGKPPDKSPFNISDFEDDTSSPFDNVELKSINDMAELAQVLQNNHQPTTTAWTNQYNYIPNTLPSSSYQQNYDIATNCSYPYTLNTVKNDEIHTTTDIVKALQAELENTHIDNTVKNNKIDLNTQTIDHLDNPFNTLALDMQKMCKSISSMGFPLDRVARTCKILGNDQKKVLKNGVFIIVVNFCYKFKVVDHLLALSELLDLGFIEKDISNALLQCDNDKDKALDKLIS